MTQGASQQNNCCVNNTSVHWGHQNGPKLHAYRFLTTAFHLWLSDFWRQFALIGGNWSWFWFQGCWYRPLTSNFFWTWFYLMCHPLSQIWQQQCQAVDLFFHCLGLKSRLEGTLRMWHGGSSHRQDCCLIYNRMALYLALPVILTLRIPCLHASTPNDVEGGN